MSERKSPERDLRSERDAGGRPRNLVMVGYDLKPPRLFGELERAVENCVPPGSGEAINLPFAPWFLASDQSTPEVLHRVVAQVGLAHRAREDRFDDRYLALELPTGMRGSHLNLEREAVWFNHHGLDVVEGDGREEGRIATTPKPSGRALYLVAPTLHAARRGHRHDVTRSIEASGRSIHLLSGLWLVHTGRSLSQVHNRIAGHLSQEDELLVLALPEGLRVAAAETNLGRRRIDWLRQHGLVLEHVAVPPWVSPEEVLPVQVREARQVSMEPH